MRVLVAVAAFLLTGVSCEAPGQTSAEIRAAGPTPEQLLRRQVEALQAHATQPRLTVTICSSPKGELSCLELDGTAARLNLHAMIELELAMIDELRRRRAREAW